MRRSLVCREREKGVEVREQARDFIFLVKAGPTDRRLFFWLNGTSFGSVSGKMRGRQIEDDKSVVVKWRKVKITLVSVFEI